MPEDCRVVAATKAIGLDMRAGLHTGDCMLRGDDLAGLGVHIAARVGALAGAGQILTTSTVRDLVIGSDLVFVDHDLAELKGIPGAWQLLAVT